MHAVNLSGFLCGAGMAGSGKTTLIKRINSHMHQQKMSGYIINLDPAVTHLPYGANIDIRDTVSRTAAETQQADGPTGSSNHRDLAGLLS